MSSHAARTTGGRRALAAALTATALAGGTLVAPAQAALPPTPVTRLVRTLPTSPFPGTDVSMSDNEDSAYVPRDDSLWLADDDGRSLYEVNATTGALKRRIRGFEIASTPALAGGAHAGTTRTDDLQGLAYDAAHDTLYAFSGTCCQAGLDPTAFRLTRQNGVLELESYQPLPVPQVAAATWNPGDGQVYIGADSTLRTFSYASDTVGPSIAVPGLSRIYGLAFTNDGRDLLVARPLSTITRVDWASRTIVPSWSLDLGAYGVRDARGVEVIGDQLWVADGDDLRPPGDPLRHAVFVVNVGSPPPAPGTPGGPSGPGTTPGNPSVANLVANAGFERNLKGWDGTHGASLTRVRGGHSGNRAARVTGPRDRATFGVTDDPGRVPTSAAGTYTASMWVRGGVGRVLKLRLTETAGKKSWGRATAKVSLGRKWKRVTVTLKTANPYRSGVDLSATVRGSGRTRFDVDDVSLTLS